MLSHYKFAQTDGNSVKNALAKASAFFWQGHKDLNPEPTVLETAALPIELYPYIQSMVGLRGLEPGTVRL